MQQMIQIDICYFNYGWQPDEAADESFKAQGGMIVMKNDVLVSTSKTRGTFDFSIQDRHKAIIIHSYGMTFDPDS